MTNLGHVKAEQLQPRAGLYPQPLGTLGTGGQIISWLLVTGYVLTSLAVLRQPANTVQPRLSRCRATSCPDDHDDDLMTS